MKKFKLGAEELLGRNSLKVIFGGNQLKGPCETCTKNSECASTVCATYSGDCVQCPCGKRCMP